MATDREFLDQVVRIFERTAKCPDSYALSHLPIDSVADEIRNLVVSGKDQWGPELWACPVAARCAYLAAYALLVGLNSLGTPPASIHIDTSAGI